MTPPVIQHACGWHSVSIHLERYMTEPIITPTRRPRLAALTAGALALAVVAAGSLAVTPAIAAPPPIAVAPTITTGSGLHPVGAVFAQDGATAYVIDQNGFINVVSTATDSVADGDQIDITADPYTSGFMSGGALSPDGSKLYAPVYNNLGGPGLLVINTVTKKVASPISLGGSSPSAVAVTPDGAAVLVLGTSAPTAPETDPQLAVFSVNPTTRAVTHIDLGDLVDSGQVPTGIAVTADSTTAYVTTDRAVVAKVNLVNRTFSNIPVSAIPRGVALSSDDSTAYVVSSDGAVQTIDSTTSTVSSLATIGSSRPSAIAITPDDAQLVVAGDSTESSTAYAWVLSAADGGRTSTFAVGPQPWAVAISPNGAKAYVPSNGNGRTSIVPLVQSAPTLTADSAAAKATVGVAYKAQFAASGYPIPTFGTTGDLPAGLTLDATTGLLSGKPTTPGKFAFRVVATNGLVPDATGTTHTVTVVGVLKAYTPTISGTKKVGKTLKSKTTAWTPAKVTLKYQWYRSSGTKWVKISKATKSSHKLVKADKKHRVRLVVTGSKTGYVTATKTSKAYTIK